MDTDHQHIVSEDQNASPTHHLPQGHQVSGGELPQLLLDESENVTPVAQHQQPLPQQPLSYTLPAFNPVEGHLRANPSAANNSNNAPPNDLKTLSSTLTVDSTSHLSMTLSMGDCIPFVGNGSGQRADLQVNAPGNPATAATGGGTAGGLVTSPLRSAPVPEFPQFSLGEDLSVGPTPLQRSLLPFSVTTPTSAVPRDSDTGGPPA